MIDNQKFSIILPARIVEYFAETQTATIQICAETLYSDASTTSGLANREPLEGVPVQTPSGGGWAITFPIEAGDTCILFFSQVGYDHWLYEDKDKAGTLAGLPKPWLRRQFSDSDGLAIVGLNTLPRAITDLSTSGSQWRNKNNTQNIHLKDNLDIELNTTASVTVNASTKLVINAPNVEVNSAVSTIVTSPTVEVTGNLVVGGTIVSTGTVTGAGVLLKEV